MLTPPYPISKIKLHDPLSLGKEKQLTSATTATATRGRKHLEEILKQSIIIIGYRNQLACSPGVHTLSFSGSTCAHSCLFTTEAVVIYHYCLKIRFLCFHVLGLFEQERYVCCFADFQDSNNVLQQKWINSNDTKWFYRIDTDAVGYVPLRYVFI